jgi:Methyltransferase domain
MLLAKKLLTDAIYIDASHDYDHVLADLNAYWDVLKPGGISFGDATQSAKGLAQRRLDQQRFQTLEAGQ